jgi:dihydroxyacetone kinase
MSTKHFFPSTEGVVVQGLENLVTRNSHLALDATNKVIYSRTHTPSKISMISGGGSGHEPAWSGYVGDGMLSAAVCGEVFASPTTKQVMAAIKQVPSDVGIILCITNYTGDNLHFGLAREKAAGLGYKVGVLKMTDDVALPRDQISNLGRRGLAANFIVLKLCGAAAEAGYEFEKVMEIGRSVNNNATTIGSSLDHCHIPGREHHRAIPQNAYVLGMGIHNEPGLHEINPMPPVEEVVGTMLKCCLDLDDKDRAFVDFKPDDVLLLLINNLGGMSAFELEALTTVTRNVLKKKYNYTPARVYAQCFETSLNAPGWSISLVNATGIERDTGVPVKTQLHLMDTETMAPAWPKTGYRDIKEGKSAETSKVATTEAAQREGPKVDPSKMEAALRQACDDAIKAEPDITKWDIQMGDGDCGEAVVGMCQGILKKVDGGVCKDGLLFKVLDEVGEAVEEVGGSLGAIISIIVTSFTTNLREAFAKNESGFQMDTKAASDAVGGAIKNLMGYTSARVGGRTVMDTLIPFSETFAKDGNFNKAVDAADEGAKSTSGMKATFGRGESSVHSFAATDLY